MMAVDKLKLDGGLKMDYVFGIDLDRGCSTNSQLEAIKEFIGKSSKSISKIIAKTSKESFDALVSQKDVLDSFTYYVDSNEPVLKLASSLQVKEYFEYHGIIFKVDSDETEFGRFIFNVEA